MPDAPELRPGMVVRWKGVSPECSCPARRHAFAGQIGIVLNNGKQIDPPDPPDHSLAVQIAQRKVTCVRPDEVTPVDEWGVEAPDTEHETLPATRQPAVGVSA